MSLKAKNIILFMLLISISKSMFATTNFAPKKSSSIDTINPKKSRIKNTALLHAGIYGASMSALYFAWYKNYPTARFHSFNDGAEWLQMDKVGHGFPAYTMSRYSLELWKHSGIEEKKAIWLGGLSGAVFQTIIEVQDGFSAQWGWSWGDMAANMAGSGLLIAQELGWKEQRIQWKLSMHKNNYADPMLSNRADAIFGKSLAERLLKDYNAQTYWLSANLHSFFPESKLPEWLNLSVGYGAKGLFGARSNQAFDGNNQIIFNRTDIPRLRQFYLSPDIDFTKIKTDKRFLKHLFFLLNTIKIPAPALELCDGTLRWNWMLF